MMLTFRPIKVWPDSFRPAHHPRPGSQFDSTYASTLTLLDHELRQLNARDALLQVDAAASDVRLDGQLRDRALVGHPGVILTVETPKHGTLVYPCDAFGPDRHGRPAWQQNLRAIALGLEALRKVERYGIADRGQQYAGYRELGAGMAMGPGSMSLDEAAALLTAACDGVWVVTPLSPDIDIVAAYRQAVKACHPDVGGDAETFRRLGEAKDLLTGAHRG